jgi:hypothetical protein
MKIMKSKRITHLLPLVFTSILAHSASAADGVTNTSVLNEFTNPLGTTITSDGAAGYSGYANVGGGSIGTFTNNGLITAPNGNGFFNNRPITSWVNNGTVSGTGTDGTGFFQYISTIGALTNTGTISGTGRAFYIYADGNINSFTNSNTGVISGTGATSPTIFLNARITTFLNEGLISGASNPAIEIGASGSFGSFTNGGDIRGITNGGSIDILNNSGTISANAVGIWSTGSINSILNNRGATIASTSAGSGLPGIYLQEGAVGAIKNYGTISSNNYVGLYILNASVTSIENNGIISGQLAGVSSGGRINSFINNDLISSSSKGVELGGSSSIDSFKNFGTISAPSGLVNYGTINLLINEIGGSITAEDSGSGIWNASTGNIIELNNSGAISARDNGYGINNDGTIITLNNSGTISVGDGVSGINNSGTITTLNNFGSITAAGVGGTGIINVGTIGTLNNTQGGNGATPATTALKYSGNLPTNYNMVIGSATRYGQLAVTDPVGAITNFGILGTPLITTRNYASVLSGTAAPTGLSSGTIDNMRWSLTANGGAFDLTFVGASLIGTQQSLVNTANALAPVYTLQNAVLSNSFSYDCPVFGEHNVCVSAGGRNTAVSAANGLNNTSALLIAAYRIKPTLRIGAYADQNLSVNNAGSTTVNLGNSTPLIGLFGVWNQRLDGTGTEVKVAAAYGQKNATVNRQIVGLSEAGSGSSNLNSQGAQITAKYGFAVLPDLLVSPYVGVRYTQNNMGGYTESTSAQVTDPLTYSALNTNATTALAGVGASYRFIPKATLFASAGVETDTNTSSGTYSATGVTGLTPVNFNPNPVKTRPTAILGAYYDIAKNQRIGITGIYRQESYQAISTTTVMATYTIGL